MAQHKLPDFQKFTDDPIYNTKAAVQRSGVPAPTLRAWERRYGVLSPERAGNDYRLYSERDVAIIRWLREMVEQGLTIRRAVDLLQRLQSNSVQDSALEAEVRATKDELAITRERNLDGDLSLTRLRRRLLNAFMEVDELKAEQIMLEALAVYNVEEFCVMLLEPVLTEIGELWSQGQLSVTVEHFASAIVRSQLFNLLKAAPRQDEGSLVLAACAPGEHHEIGLLMVTLFLRRQGLQVLYLGQNIEIGDFMVSIKQWQPEMVVLSAATMAGLGGIVEIARRIEQLPEEEQLVFGFGGRVFNIHPELVTKLPGYYLGANALEASQKVRELVRAHFVPD